MTIDPATRRTILIAVALCLAASLLIWSGRLIEVTVDRRVAILMVWVAGAVLIARRIILRRGGRGRR